MSYIGRGTDKISNVEKLDNISFSGSTATFNLTKGGTAFIPSSAECIRLAIDGIEQGNNYTVSGSQITFDFTPSGSSTNNWIYHIGVGVITTPADGSVTNAKLGADSVNGSKIADDSISDEHLDNTAITGQTAITSLQDTDKFLVSDASDSGNLKYVESQYVGGGLDNWSESSGNLLPSNASYGIYLGVNSATATNLLQDYEEGELSNALMIASTTQTSYSSGRANLQYTKIGRIVHCQALIDTDGQTLATTGVVKLRLPFAVSDGSGTAMAGGTPFLSPSVNGDVYPSRLYLDENVTSAPFNKMQCQAAGSYLQFGEQLQVSNTSHRIYIHACFSYQTDA